MNLAPKKGKKTTIKNKVLHKMYVWQCIAISSPCAVKLFNIFIFCTLFEDTFGDF